MNKKVDMEENDPLVSTSRRGGAAMPRTFSMTSLKWTLLLGCATFILLSWTLKQVSWSGKNGCVRKEGTSSTTMSIDDELRDAANGIAQDDISTFQIDDGDEETDALPDELEEPAQDKPGGDDDDTQTANEEVIDESTKLTETEGLNGDISKKTRARSNSKDNVEKLNDDDGIDKSKESAKNDDVDKFRPLAEDTLGYAMKKYSSPLAKLSSTLMESDEKEQARIPRDEGVHIITTFFHGTYKDPRFKEIMATLVSNLENPYITALHVMWQGADPRFLIPNEIASKIVAQGLHNKLILTEVFSQPTYKMMFSYANDNLKRGAIVIVTNADIYWDSSLKCIEMPAKNHTMIWQHPEQVKNRVAFALSRRHSPVCKQKPDHLSIMDLCEEYSLSHDAFVFTIPVPKSVVARTDHTQNQGYGAENIVIFEFKRAGFKVLNPCLSIKGYHLHCVDERHYVVKFVNRSPPRPGSSFPIARKCGMLIF